MVWGSGKPKREFLYVDDMAAASVYVMELDKTIYDKNTEPMLSHINVGYGDDVSIRETAELVAKTVGYEGKLVLDATKPDGAPRKLMDISRLEEMGWSPKIELKEGIQLAYHDFLKGHVRNS